MTQRLRSIWLEIKIRFLLFIVHLQAIQMSHSDKQCAREWITRWRFNSADFPSDVQVFIDKELLMVEKAIS